MAIDVNQVYKTVLLILNKEQRGYMTPNEFNKIATQVQRETFERYFDDLNQNVRIQQTDFDYADRVYNTDEKIAEFKRFGAATYVAGTPTTPNKFTLPADLYRLSTVTYEGGMQPTELQRLNRNEFYNVSKSPLTKPTKGCPMYLYEDNNLIVYPNDIDANVNVSYVKKPDEVIWAYEIDPTTNAFIFTTSSGAGVYPSGGYKDFELHNSERAEVVLNILMYAGIVIRDPQVVQGAMQKIQQDEANEKQ